MIYKTTKENKDEHSFHSILLVPMSNRTKTNNLHTFILSHLE